MTLLYFASSGETVEEAQESAATNALEYLQMMIKWLKTEIVYCIYDDVFITVILKQVFVWYIYNCVCFELMSSHHFSEEE